MQDCSDNAMKYDFIGIRTSSGHSLCFVFIFNSKVKMLYSGKDNNASTGFITPKPRYFCECHCRCQFALSPKHGHRNVVQDHGKDATTRPKTRFTLFISYYISPWDSLPLNYNVLERAAKFGKIKVYKKPVWIITGHIIKHHDMYIVTRGIQILMSMKLNSMRCNWALLLQKWMVIWDRRSQQHRSWANTEEPVNVL